MERRCSSSSPMTVVNGEGSCLLNPVTVEGRGSSLFPNALLASDLVRLGVMRPPKLLFSGWGAPTMGWKEWVTAMSRQDTVVKVWRDAGIEDALMASLNDITPDPEVMAALSGFWCSATSTFIFPWGEASFTIEDAHLLGNLAIRGSSLDRSLTADEQELWSRLVVEKEKIWELHPTAKLQGRITNEIWVEWFTSLEGEDQLMHLGFLAYWLSSHVFPSKPTGEVSPNVFRAAARLYRGERIALAPAVTASIYRNLSTIAASARNCVGRKRAHKLDAWAQFGLVQTWIWERFKTLRPRTQGIIPPDSRVRATRWSGRRSRPMCYDEAVEVFRDDSLFTWRPYSEPISNWEQPEWYSQEFREIITAEHSTPTWVYDFLAIISSETLEGFSCDGRIISESYFPHRVGMQLGYDQAIPELWISQGGTSWGKKPLGGFQFHIVGIGKSGVRMDCYQDWWKQYMAWYIKFLNEYIVQGVCDHQGKSKIKKKEKRAVSGQQHAVNQGSDLMLSNTKEMHMQVFKVKAATELVKTSNDCGNHREATSRPAGHAALALETANYKNVASIITQGSFSPLGTQAVNGLGEETMHIPRSQKSTFLPLEAAGENQARLLKELKAFECNGLVMEWASDNSPNEISTENKMAFVGEDPCGHEAMRMFPRFFILIPQRPHYRGLLEGNIRKEGIGRDICTSLWFRLVDLMKKALSSSWQSNPLKVDEHLREARHLEQLGFDVRHLIARLMELQNQLRNQKSYVRLDEAKTRYGKERR